MSVAEKHLYSANVEQLMNIIIHSVYTNKEFFLRELVSNASDALDKLAKHYTKFENLMTPNEWYVEIKAVGNQLIITDTGIGMKKEDLISFIGSIAESGTKKFKELEKNTNLIGQFGIGFYSSFLVADTVEVITKHPQDDCYKWVSDGTSGYSITSHEDGRKHGTTLILNIKKGEEEFLNMEKISELLKKFSTFIQYPIFVIKKKFVEEEKPVTEEGDVTEINDDVTEIKDDVTEIKDDVTEIKDGDEVEIKQKKEIEERIKVNKEQELWNKKTEEIPEEDLLEFYKTISGDWEGFSDCKVFSLEGKINYKILLFIPKRMPMNLFDKSYKKNRLKLYCSNVFVTDDLNVLPESLSFITGIISVDDLPMSISRENIQGTTFYKGLKKLLTNKVIDMIEQVKDANEFYKEYSSCIKLMARDDDRFHKFLKYYSTSNPNELMSLDDYIKDEAVKEILVVTGLTKEECLESFFLKKYKDSNVLLLCEPADELLLQSFKTYKEKPIKRITILAPNTASEETPFMTDLKTLLNLESVFINNTLGDIPCLINSSQHGTSGTFEKMLQAQNANHPFFSFGLNKKVLEINMEHHLVKRICKSYEEKDDKYKKFVNVMYNIGLLSCGYKIGDLENFCNNVYELLGKGI